MARKPGLNEFLRITTFLSVFSLFFFVSSKPFAGSPPGSTENAYQIPESYNSDQDGTDCSSCHTTRLEERMRTRKTGHDFDFKTPERAQRTLERMIRILYGPDSLYLSGSEEAPDSNKIWGIAEVAWKIDDVDNALLSISAQKQSDIAAARRIAEEPYRLKIKGNHDIDPRIIEGEMKLVSDYAADSVENSWRDDIDFVSNYRTASLNHYPLLGLEVWDKDPGIIEEPAAYLFGNKHFKFLYRHLYYYLETKGYDPAKPETHTLDPMDPNDSKIIMLLQRAFKRLGEEELAPRSERYYRKGEFREKVTP